MLTSCVGCACRCPCAQNTRVLIQNSPGTLARIPHMIGREGTIIEVPTSGDGTGWYKVRTDSSRKPVKVQLAGLAIIESFKAPGATDGAEPAGNGTSPRKGQGGDKRATSPARHTDAARGAGDAGATEVGSEAGDASPAGRRPESRVGSVTGPAKPTLLSNTDSATWMGATVQVSTGKGRRTQVCGTPLVWCVAGPAVATPPHAGARDTTCHRPPLCGWVRVG